MGTVASTAFTVSTNHSYHRPHILAIPRIQNHLSPGETGPNHLGSGGLSGLRLVSGCTGWHRPRTPVGRWASTPDSHSSVYGMWAVCGSATSSLWRILASVTLHHCIKTPTIPGSSRCIRLPGWSWRAFRQWLRTRHNEWWLIYFSYYDCMFKWCCSYTLKLNSEIITLSVCPFRHWVVFLGSRGHCFVCVGATAFCPFDSVAQSHVKFKWFLSLLLIKLCNYNLCFALSVCL